MKFRTVNDLNTISINEMKLISMELTQQSLVLKLEGAVVKADNSNNNRYEDVYCADMVLVFKGLKLLSFCCAGFKYYDADGRLINEVPGRPLEDKDIQKAVDIKNGAWVFSLECFDPENQIYRLIYDVEDEETKTYEAEFTFLESTASWERFAGPVEG